MISFQDHKRRRKEEKRGRSPSQLATPTYLPSLKTGANCLKSNRALPEYTLANVQASVYVERCSILHVLDNVHFAAARACV